MEHLIDKMLSGFWQFIGGMIIMYTVLHYLFLFWNRFWRHFNIRKHGYPPNTDADGDFPQIEE